jgi:glycosyltransferase involved in cell wall biosynthesis
VPDKLSVLFIHGVAEIGGAERELLLMLDQLPRFGYEPLLVCPEQGPLLDEVNRRGILHRDVLLPAWRKLFAYPQRSSAVRQLREVIQTLRPALLHVNDIWWVPQALRAAGRAAPVVAHARQEVDPAKVKRYELDRADCILAVSHCIQSALEAGGVSPSRVQTVYSGVPLGQIPSRIDGRELRVSLGIPVGTPLIGTVANLFPRKGYEVMLRAMSAVLRTRPDVHYLIVGKGEHGYEETLRELVCSLGIHKHVHFAGFQERVYPYLAALTLYVQPALMEGFGIAVLEAMAIGKPVVATRAGGLPEIVDHEKTGLLVPPGNSDALAAAVLVLLQDPARATAMGQAGQSRVALFSVEKMMEQLTQVYGAVLARAEMAGQRVPV